MSERASRIVVGLSGGVDSAVAALRLLERGHEVHGLYMANWEDDDGYCTAAQDFQDARAVAEVLGIPLHRVDFSREYRERVFASFLAQYEAGRTPNPDVLCNREIKFGVCLAHARRLGAARFATGHYARLRHDGPPQLHKGADLARDQSYFLHSIEREALAAIEFPIGDLLKDDVRAIARAAGLPVYDKPDSTGICFIGERPFREFLQRYLPTEPGEIRSLDDDKRVGRHQGLMYHTLGQRKGLGIGGIKGGDAAGEHAAWYVARKDLARNVLYVVQGHDHPALLSTRLVADDLSWVAGEPPPACAGYGAKTRYRQTDAPCVIESLDAGRMILTFEQPQWAVTPGQSAVLYSGDVCLGGGIIA